MPRTASPPTPLSTRLVTARVEQNLTQEEAARRVGLTYSTLSNVERGRSMSLRTALRFVDYYGLDLDEFWALARETFLS